MGLTFGPERRIKRRRDFLRVQAIGQRASSAHFVLLVAARETPATTTGPTCSRLGIVVTRKIGNAVQRNRIKRVCREAFRAWPDLVPDGIDLVLIARAGAHELGLEAVRGEWQRAHRSLLQRCTAVLLAPRPENAANAGKK